MMSALGESLQQERHTMLKWLQGKTWEEKEKKRREQHWQLHVNYIFMLPSYPSSGLVVEIPGRR
jgi:hypothetical protein